MQFQAARFRTIPASYSSMRWIKSAKHYDTNVLSSLKEVGTDRIISPAKRILSCHLHANCNTIPSYPTLSHPFLTVPLTPM
ncbi:hypothetical protein EYC84_006709 [Monilinia fructicola]|uniref:Uncharacterized protein n=1 Tax=Monilinia fructicola TaxID=38448 RepID=A0A5M9K948_MONFR|nr:hypothetical protein EYC84_006709 [Monilinia fructicola]